MTITPESVQKLIRSEDYGDRIRGINQLAHLEPAIALELLQPLVKDENVRVRYSATSKMASLGTQDLAMAAHLLRDRLLNDPELDVKAAAADALGALKLTEAFEDLQQLYQQSSDWIVKLSIVAALGELGHEEGFDILQDALQSGEDLLQNAAIGAFGELGDKRAIPLILPFVANEDWQTRFRVAQALGRLGGEPVQAALETLATDQFEQVAQEAKIYL